jgi:hypothetical protein
VTWKDSKRLIARIIGPRLAQLGFVNPGRRMWRYRPAFVDVVFFECRRAGSFTVWFGCGLRDRVPINPEPCECAFEVSPANVFPWPPEWLRIRPPALAEAVFEEMAPRVVEAAEQWFGQLSTPQAAIRALLANERHTPRHVFYGNPGSPSWQRVMADLVAASNRTPPIAG